LLYFVSSELKKLIIQIDGIAYVTTGNSIMGNFITKYHDSHKLNMYRLIRTNENVNTLSDDIVKNVLNNIGIDLLCVAAHYSERYNNADNFLNTKVESDIKNYVLYFVKNELQSIICDFIEQCIDETVVAESQITWKNMHYIWKIYLSSLNIPNMIYSQQLQEILITKITNKNDFGNIIFTNVTSKYLPNVSSFLSFWDKYITITSDTSIDDEYEIDELITLYKSSDKKVSQITEANIIKMICHYFSPQVEVVDNKYITNIKCNLWSKHDDINEFLESYKSHIDNTDTDNTNTGIKEKPDIISIDDLYQSYKVYFKAKGTVEQKNYPIVSKQFFEKYITNQLTKYIKFDKFVSSEWLQV
jgi:hypothetical protein